MNPTTRVCVLCSPTRVSASPGPLSRFAAILRRTTRRRRGGEGKEKRVDVLVANCAWWDARLCAFFSVRVCVRVCARTEERACFFEEIYLYTKQNRFYYTKATSQQPAGANRRRRNSLKSQRDGFKIKQRGADDFTLPHLSGFYFLSSFFFRNEHDWIDIRRF